ncbi:MAG: O-antigen ligase family protein [Patescibacteria group bacterium]
MLKFIYQTGQFLVYASLFLPLFVHSSFVFPFITPRNYAFRILLAIAAAVLAVLWVYYKELRPKKSWLHFAVLAVILAKVLSGLFGENLYNSFWSGYERMEGILTWLYLGVYYFLIVSVFRTRDEWIWLFRVSLVPAALVAIYGIMQAAGVDTALVARQARIESTLGNAAYIGAYMVVHMGIALYLIFRDRITWVRIVAGLSLVISTIALVLSETRGAAIGLIIGFFVATLTTVYLSKAEEARQRNIAAGLLVALILLAGSVWMLRDTAVVQNIGIVNRVVTIRLDEGTVNSRLNIWKLAIEGFKEKPVFGWGQENFHLIYNKYYTVDIGEEWVDRAHNNLLDQLSMNGLVGLLAYLAVIGYPFYAFWQYRRKDTLVAGILLGLWSAYVVQNQFVFDSLNTYIPFFILLGFSREIARESRDEAEPTRFANTAYRASDAPIFFVGALIASVVLTVVINLPGYKANLATIQGLARISALPEQSYEYLKEAVEYESFGNKEIVMQLQLALNSYLLDKNLSDEFKTEAVLFTIDATDDVIEKHPHDARFIAFGGNINLIARPLGPQYIVRAEEFMERAIEVSPNRPDLYLQLGEIVQLQNRNAQAIEHYKTVVELAPTRVKTVMAVVTKLNQMGEYELALELADDVLNTHWDVLKNDQKTTVGSLYIQARDWDNAIAVFEELVNDNPNNANYWPLLADAYEGAGRLQEAEAIRVEVDKVKQRDADL